MTTSSAIRAWAVHEATRPAEPFSYDAGPLGAEEVEIKVDHCGLCHSDLSVIENEWKNTPYPVVGGHEVIGTVVALGSQSKGLKLGQRVGLGWILNFGIKPTHRVGVVGIGGLGHLALKFARAWGCEVTAFTSSESKRDEAMQMGAHRVVSSVDAASMKALRGQLDMVLVTVNVMLNWKALMSTLAPHGRLHLVGVLPQAMELEAGPLIGGQRSVSGSPTGSRQDIDTMLEFAARHGIAPQTEHFPMSRINDALDHLRAGKARYRVVLDADFAPSA